MPFLLPCVTTQQTAKWLPVPAVPCGVCPRTMVNFQLIILCRGSVSRRCAIIFQSHSISPDIRATISRLCGIEAILGAMKAHPEDSKLAKYACGALSNLSENDGRSCSLFF